MGTGTAPPRSHPRHWTAAATRRVVTDPSSCRAVVAIVTLLGWVALPSRRDAVLTTFGAGLLVVATVEVVQAFHLNRIGWPAGIVRAAAPVAACVALVAVTGHPGDHLPLASGVLLAGRGTADLLGAVTVGPVARLAWWLGGLGLTELALGVTSIVATDLFGQVSIVVVGFGWLAGGVVTFVVEPVPSVRAVTRAPVARVSRLPAEERDRIADAVFFDAADIRDRLGRYLALLTLATVIATYGVLSNSVASVIGAMIIAPLSLPIQSLAAALVAGAARQARVAATVLAGGVALVLLLSMFLASTFRDLAVVLQVDQVTARTSPTLTDLAVALAAGAAGGYALLRRDVADSLPGVAIAVSLVPPLCVSGAALAGGETSDAAGAFLLFAVNFVAIVVVSGGVLFLGGFGSLTGQAPRRLAVYAVAFGVVAAVLAVPLAVIGLGALQQESVESSARVALVDWLDPVQPANVLKLEVQDDHVTVLVASSAQPPSSDQLAHAISDAVGHSVTVTVHWVQASTLP